VPTCLSEVAFGAFLAYSPRGTSEESKRSRTITYDIKADRANAIRRVVERLAKEIATHPGAHVLTGILDRSAVLVPCPRSSPIVEGALWPPERIAMALQGRGLGAEVRRLLVRVTAVRSSSAAQRGERPTIQEHLETMRVVDERSIFSAQSIVIVDDVITKGATLLAAASLLKKAFPAAEIRAFALVRTMGLQPEVDRILDPCTGTVKNRNDKAEREP
jgi:predicted amidophosphoribosyltransferase